MGPHVVQLRLWRDLVRRSGGPMACSARAACRLRLGPAAGVQRRPRGSRLPGSPAERPPRQPPAARPDWRRRTADPRAAPHGRGRPEQQPDEGRRHSERRPHRATMAMRAQTRGRGGCWFNRNDRGFDRGDRRREHVRPPIAQKGDQLVRYRLRRPEAPDASGSASIGSYTSYRLARNRSISSSSANTSARSASAASGQSITIRIGGHHALIPSSRFRLASNPRNLSKCPVLTDPDRPAPGDMLRASASSTLRPTITRSRMISCCPSDSAG